MKKCPKCGHDKFIVTAHVTQTWLVDNKENFLETLDDCDQVTHAPNDEDIWTCDKCGYDAAGKKFNID